MLQKILLQISSIPITWKRKEIETTTNFILNVCDGIPITGTFNLYKIPYLILFDPYETRSFFVYLSLSYLLCRI